MKIVRFPDKGIIKFGILDGNAISSYQGSPFTESADGDVQFQPDGNHYNLADVRLLAPCTPSKLVCLGLNYHSHAKEVNLPVPTIPLIFLKPSTAVIGPNNDIVLPRASRRVDYEGELAIVIGKRAKGIPEAEAKKYVLGYTCLNDVSERHNQKEDGQWSRAKGYDTFAPFGPCIATDINADDLKIETVVNGVVRQSARTTDLIFGISTLISFISNVMTLLPGDLIATGTTLGIGPLNTGDTVDVIIENIGTLRNRVIREK